MQIPLFPLHTVLSPGLALPLHVFEERYRADGPALPRRVDAVRRRPDPRGQRGRAAQRRSQELAIASVGTFAEIREASRYSDGRWDLLAVGAGPVRDRHRPQRRRALSPRGRRAARRRARRPDGRRGAGRPGVPPVRRLPPPPAAARRRGRPADRRPGRGRGADDDGRDARGARDPGDATSSATTMRRQARAGRGARRCGSPTTRRSCRSC